MKTLYFPDDFSFGVGDADLQVVGEQNTYVNEGALPSMWQKFSEIPGKVFNGDSPLIAIDRYHRFAEDVNLMRELGIDSYRTSISMCRTINIDGSANKKGLEWYRRYFSLLRSHGIRIAATLYHWELPAFCVDQGGWLSLQTVDLFLKHVAVVQRELGDLIDEYFIQNEPWSSGFLGYHLGVFAPGVVDLTKALIAIHNLLLAQARAIRLIKQTDSSVQVGTVYNLVPAYAAENTDSCLQAAILADCYNNRWFLDPLYLGRYPTALLEQLAAVLPNFDRSELAEMRVGDLLDSFGINYYGGSLVRASTTSPFGFEALRHPDEVKNSLGWSIFAPPIYPSGLYDMLLQFYARYQEFGLKRIYIAENGTAWPSQSDVHSQVDLNDEFRINYLKEHMGQVLRAIQAGVPIKGYFLWTLMDNFEWAEGYRPQSNFGIVHIDRETLKRTPKKSFEWFKAVIKKRCL